MRGLDHTEAKKVLKHLRKLGIAPPAAGSCVTVKPHVRLCRNHPEQYTPGGTGYVVVADGPHGLFGARRRRRKRR